MKMNELNSRTAVAALGVLVVGLGGCIEYTIETTLVRDGSGVRTEEMVVEVGDSGESGGVSYRISDAEFGQLMNVGEDKRWSHSLHIEGGDTLHVFSRDTRVNSLAAWTDLSDEVRIAGATSAGAEVSVGRVKLGDVHFRNRVRVERGRVTEGTSFTYRETFYWENLADVLVEYFVREYTNAVIAKYPNLDGAQRGELNGVVTGAVWFAVGQGLFESSGDEESELVSALAKSTGARAAEIVQRRYARDAPAGFFVNLLEEVHRDESGEFEDFIEQQLPGVQLAINSEIIFRLSMPGRILSSNAHDRDGNMLIWEFVPGDALSAPLEIRAESVVGR